MTTTANEKKNINFRFRTKFQTFVTEENQQNFLEAFEKFCSFPQERARQFLWRLTYTEWWAYALFNEIELKSTSISSENYLSLRNELRYQYEKNNPNFLKTKVGEGAQEAQNQLARYNDPIMAYIVTLACKKYLSKDLCNVEKTLHLLKSDLENFNFGGLRSLEFNDEEARYLLPFSMDIHDLLEALWRFGFSNEETDEQKDEEKIDADEDNAEVFGFKPLTAEAVLANESEFEDFSFTGDMNTLMKIGSLGFDLNEVVDKKGRIYNLLIAASALED